MKKTLLSLSIITVLFGFNIASANTTNYTLEEQGTSSSVDSVLSLKQKLGELNKEYSLKYREYMMLNQEIKQAQKILSVEENKKYKDAILKITTDMKQEIADIYAKYQPKIAELEAKLKEYGTKEAIYKRSQEGKEEFKEILTQLKEQKILLSEEIKKAKNILDKLKAEKEKYTSTASQIPEKIKSEFSDRLNEIMSEITSLKEEITQLNKQIAEQAQKEKAELLAKKQQQQEAYMEYKKAMESLSLEVQERKSKLQEMFNQALVQIEEMKKNALTSLELEKEKIKEIQSQIESLNKEYEFKYQEIKQLSAVTMEKINSYFNGYINQETMRLKTMLQNNIITDKEYDIQMSTMLNRVNAGKSMEISKIISETESQISSLFKEKEARILFLNKQIEEIENQIKQRETYINDEYNKALILAKQTFEIETKKINEYYVTEKAKLDSTLQSVNYK